MPTIPGVTPTPASLPAGWTTSPTTTASFNATVIVIQENLGTAKAAAFRAWYTLAWKADPNLTPDQAVGIWYSGSTLQEGVGGAATLLGQVPQAATTALTNTSAVKAVDAVSNPLDWLSNIADFFSRLSQANTWIRIAEFGLGGALILVGVAHMAKGTQVGQTAAKVAKTAGLAAAL